MRVITIVSLGASAVLGLGALVVAKAVLPKTAAGGVAVAAPHAVEGVPVVVAAKALKFGDKLTADQLKVVAMPAEAVPEGHFTTVAAVLSQDAGGPPVALTAIAEREPLLPSKLSGPGARKTVAAEIADGMRAFTIKVNDASGVGGHALPGDRVDVVLTRDLTPEGARRTYVSSLLVQNVRVLAIDLNADLASDKPATPSTATLEVGPADSQKLATGGQLGTLSLALRRTGAIDTEAAAAALPVAAPSAAPAPVRVRTPRRAAAPSEGGGLITIVEGDGHAARAAPLPAASALSGAPAAAASAVKASVG